VPLSLTRLLDGPLSPRHVFSWDENEGPFGLYVTAGNKVLLVVYMGVKLEFPC
jgi:hypothetical protein